jgi:2-oxoisovalerate ferredoxin oxidoreductase beta subunit
MSAHSVLGKPHAFYDHFLRKGGTETETTHYCPGCGHGNLHKIIAEALDDLGVRERAILVFPVGCAVFGYYYFRCGNIQAAHGRAPAVATAVKRAHPESVVICYQGDGDLAAIGGNNILHAANRGENFTVIFVNNAIYGMTGGQMAPTTLPHQVTTTSPRGRDERNDGFPLRVCELLATLKGPAYIERTALDETKHLLKARTAIRRALKAQIEGRGFSLVEVLSPCPTGWGLDPVAARRWVAQAMIPEFPLGVFKDRLKEPLPPPPASRPAPSKEEILAAIGLSAPGAERVAQAPAGLHRMVLAGFGGQGVMFLGALLAHTGMVQGRHVSWLPSYGPEMRGGTAHCHVVISDRRIGSPLVSVPDVLVAFNEPSLLKFGPRVRPGGMVVYDSTFVVEKWDRGDVRVRALPFSRIANELGSAKSLNMVAFGAVNRFLGLYPQALIERQLRETGKEKYRELNLRAVAAGAEAAEQCLAGAAGAAPR